MFSADDPYVEFLRSRRDQAIYLKPWWGNAGDQLIWMGTKTLLDELGLRRVLNPQKAGVILFAGGNLTMWNGNLGQLQDCWTRWPGAETVVGPATFQGSEFPWPEMLTKAHARIGGLFARDPESYQNLRGLNLPPAVKIGLGHDPSFNLKDTQWITELREACSSEYALACFRGDHESAARLPRGNRLMRVWPLSSWFRGHKDRCQAKHRQERMDLVKRMADSKLPLFEQDASLMSFELFVECISRAGQVHTDRLHCMIMGLLLGKPVFGYQTAYGKLESVYEHSIKSWATVQFVRG